MSHRLISLNQDIKRLRDEGFSVDIRGNYLVVHRFPYVDSQGQVRFGTFVSELSRQGEEIRPPESHVAMFAGEHPCRSDGTPLEKIRHASSRQTLLPASDNPPRPALIVDHSFSCKPLANNGKYRDYYEKVTTYEAVICGQAEILEAVTARCFEPVEASADESVFRYWDTASSRANIDAITARLAAVKSIAIVGLGGTGSYVLDLVAKTPVGSIHLYDGDRFSNHNAFRSPGAASLEDLRTDPIKSEYFRDKYSNMHRHVHAHPNVTEENIAELKSVDFLFLCLDSGESKRLLVASLEEYGKPFIDVGMGIHHSEHGLFGVVSVTTSTPAMRSHVHERRRIHFTDGVDNEYARNIQIADLNALNAALAVIRWKKLFGFYNDFDQEHYSTYTIDGNILLNDDKP